MNSATDILLSFSWIICIPNKYKSLSERSSARTPCTKHSLRVTVVTGTKLEQEHCHYNACLNLMGNENKHKCGFRNAFTCRKTAKQRKNKQTKETILFPCIYNQRECSVSQPLRSIVI